MLNQLFSDTTVEPLYNGHRSESSFWPL